MHVVRGTLSGGGLKLGRAFHCPSVFEGWAVPVAPLKSAFPATPPDCTLHEVYLLVPLMGFSPFEKRFPSFSFFPPEQELKNNKIEEDLDRGLSGAGHHSLSHSSLGGGSHLSHSSLGGGGHLSHSSLTSGSLASLSGPSSLGSLQPSMQSPLR